MREICNAGTSFGDATLRIRLQVHNYRSQSCFFTTDSTLNLTFSPGRREKVYRPDAPSTNSSILSTPSVWLIELATAKHS